MTPGTQRESKLCGVLSYTVLPAYLLHKEKFENPALCTTAHESGLQLADGFYKCWHGACLWRPGKNQMLQPAA